MTRDLAPCFSMFRSRLYVPGYNKVHCQAMRRRSSRVSAVYRNRTLLNMTSNDIDFTALPVEPVNTLIRSRELEQN